MEKQELNIIEPIVDLVMGLWQRSDRDFNKKSSRDAFRSVCCKILKGEDIEVEEPNEDTPKDSVDWARYVAASDCKSLAILVSNMTTLLNRSTQRVYFCGDESDSDSEYYEGMMPFSYGFKRRRKNKVNPSTDRRFKANKTQEQIEKQNKALALARENARQSSYLASGLSAPESVEPLQKVDTNPKVDESGNNETLVQSEVEPVTQGDISYMPKRKKNSKPIMVPLPPLPTNYQEEHKWVKENIKTPDMLYSYVRKKSGDGILWSSGMRKYFDNNDFWEFAFDTLSCGGWCDSESNRPIFNIAKYITKVTIGEFDRHEASKHSRFEGKFKTGKDLLDYLSIHVLNIKPEFKEEGFCDWFVQKMNEVSWRWNNGTTINNIAGQMSRMYNDYQIWKTENAENLAGLNESQYGVAARIHKAIVTGEWKPQANGKYSAMDMKKFLVQS